VGTLVSHKGVHVLIEAVRQLDPSSYELVLYGDLNTFPEYVAELRKLAEGAPVHFKGAFDSTATSDIYGQFDVLVVPSLWLENSPLVIHEAFQAGVPVVGSRMGGTVDLVRHGEWGLLYDADSPDALAGALRSIVADRRVLDGGRRACPGEVDRGGRARVGGHVSAAGLRGRIDVSAPLVSIVLLTWNGGSGLRELVGAIAGQRADFSFEIVAVDSGSTDGTANGWSSRRPWRASCVSRPNSSITAPLVTWPIEQAKGASSSDRAGRAADRRRLAGAPGRRRCAATRASRGRSAAQRPRPDARAITVRYLEGGPARPRTRAASRSRTRRRSTRWIQAAQLQACTFDNVCSCLRRSVWEQIPFRATVIAEDLEWARRALQAGHSLEYVADAVVVHSHDRSAGYELARTYLLHHRLFELFGLRTIPRVRDLPRAVASSARLHLSCERTARAAGRGAAGWGRALGLAVAWPLGQYLGGLAASKATGRCGGGPSDARPRDRARLSAAGAGRQRDLRLTIMRARCASGAVDEVFVLTREQDASRPNTSCDSRTATGCASPG
jgi:GT2 family glycosyltransferase